MTKKKKGKETDPDAPDETVKPVALEVNVIDLQQMQMSGLHDLQGGFKELTPANEQRLLNEILVLGLCEPFTAAYVASDEKFYLLNGHMRAHVIQKLQAEGSLAEDIKFPVITVAVPDKKRAIEICMALTSQYGTVTKAGLAKFAKKGNLELDSLQERFNWPELDMADLQEKIKKDKAKAEEDPETEKDKGTRYKSVTCPSCGKKFKTPA